MIQLDLPTRLAAAMPTDNCAAVVRVVGAARAAGPSHLDAAGTRACERSTRFRQYSYLYTCAVEQVRTALVASVTMPSGEAAGKDGPEGVLEGGVSCTCVQ